MNDQIVQEISVVLQHLAEKGDTWVADWIANHICKDHWSGLSRGRAGEFWRWAGYNQVRRMVAKETPDRVHLHAV